MSRIIKSDAAQILSSVRPIGARAPAIMPSHADEDRERLRQVVATLEGQLRERDDAIEVLRKDVPRAFDDGMAQGRDGGLAEAQDCQAERLAVLETAARDAKAEVAAHLGSLERLSALLARDCVGKGLGDSAEHADLIARIVAAQIARIDKAMLLGIEVSRSDFPEDAALAGLALRLGFAPSAITARGDLPAGGCIMVLRLGRMNIGIDQQWGALAALLDDMALPEAAE